MRGLRCRLAVPKPVFLSLYNPTDTKSEGRALLSVSGTGWKEERVGPESDPEAEVFLAVECWEAAAAVATTAGEAAL